MRPSEPGRVLKQGLVLLLTYLAILRNAGVRGVSCPLANSVRAGRYRKEPSSAHVCMTVLARVSPSLLTFPRRAVLAPSRWNAYPQVDGLTAAGYTFTDSDTGSAHTNGSISLQQITFDSPEVSLPSHAWLTGTGIERLRANSRRKARDCCIGFSMTLVLYMCRQRSDDLETTIGRSLLTSRAPLCRMQVVSFSPINTLFNNMPFSFRFLLLW